MIPINQSLMTKNERIVYKKLRNCISEKYIIFPQISIRSIIKRNFKTYNDTQWKIIDFLICETSEYKPILAVEVNDKTHEEYERKIRDNHVTTILQEMNLPIWFLKPENDYTRFDNINLDEHIKMMIDKHLEYKKIGFNKNNLEEQTSNTKTIQPEEKICITKEQFNSLSQQIKNLTKEKDDANKALFIKDKYYKEIIKNKDIEIKNKNNEIKNGKDEQKLIISGLISALVTLILFIAIILWK